VSSVTREGQAVAFTLETIKGLSQVRFDSPSGSYTVQYAAQDTPPTIGPINVTAGEFAAILTWNTDRATSFKVEYGTTADLLNANVASQIFATQHSAALQGLSPATTYYFRVSVTDVFGNVTTFPLMSSAPSSFTTQAVSTFSCPCSIWSEDQLPTLESTADSNAVELGMKFKSTTNGYVTGVRFYKGPLNTGVHTGHLWTSTGTLLGTVTFADGSETGWQEARFSEP